MGALTPLFLLAGAAVAVPLYLHLFQRQEARRLSFPALRYLERTEREHARRIRFRQFLLLFLRVLALLVLVGAGARLFLRGSGSAHPPTALAIVLDNSMSAGLVMGEDRTLDRLKALALRGLATATEDDRIWVIRAGEPWLPAVPGGPAEARRWVEETGLSAGRGDVTGALRRAAELVATADLGAREIHLLTDLQATAFDLAAAPPAGDVPVVVWLGDREATFLNRALTGVVVGGGLSPLEGQRSEIALYAAAATGDTLGVPVRIVMGERVRGAGVLPSGASLVLPLPPAPAGWVLGYADADPDALRADDRRYFAYRSRPAPALAVVGDPGLFVTEAAAVLEAGGRVRRTSAREADAVVAAAGEGLAAVGAGGSVLVVPPADPTLLPSVNRRLQEAGIPWRFERSEAQGSVPLTGPALPEALRHVQVRDAYRLVLSGDPVAAPRTLALADGEPWAVEGSDVTGRRYLLVASALDATSTSLPVSSDMVGFVDWFVGAWAAAAGGGDAAREAGAPLSAPRGAEAVRLPSGAEVPLDGTRMVPGTGEAGIYAFLAGDTVLAYEAVNPPPAESDLTPLDPDLLPSAVGPEAVAVRRATAWERALFRARRGPELGRPLVIAALLLLLLEAAVAATGRQPGPRRAQSPTEAVRVRS